MQEILYRVIFFDLGKTLVIPGEGWIPGAKDLLERLRAAGIPLGVISNTDGLTDEQLRDLLPPDFDFSIFEANLILLSSKVGIKKPDPRIFRAAIAAAGVPPSECLFCTESLLDTLAAQQVGMHTVRLESPPSRDLGRLPGELETLTTVISGG